ncbi:hypothetical protein TWF106_006167 [Orbilia oligospora]|uniref:Uncharacterized protein n=1 Tax=Orbilia oligospora TaxID=2813651 RepID=A0A7C8UBU5_ORBOL|nr:hypothetical protein TWF106_006167 [Orbilia oligospora]
MDSTTAAALTAQIEKHTRHMERQQREIEEIKAKVGTLESNSRIFAEVCQPIALAAFADHILGEYGWNGELRDPFVSKHSEKLAKLYDISVAETLAFFRYYSFINDQSSTSSRIDTFSTSQRRNIAARQCTSRVVAHFLKNTPNTTGSKIFKKRFGMTSSQYLRCGKKEPIGRWIGPSATGNS